MEWGEEEGGGAGGRQGQRPTDAGYAEQQPGTQSFLLSVRGSVSSRVSFAGPGRGPSPGPPEDDVDLSVLHALGRSGCFSWGVDPPPPYPSSESPLCGGSVGVRGGGASLPLWAEGQTYSSSPSACVLPHPQAQALVPQLSTPPPTALTPVEAGAIRRRKPPGSVFPLGASPAPPAPP